MFGYVFVLPVVYTMAYAYKSFNKNLHNDRAPHSYFMSPPCFLDNKHTLESAYNMSTDRFRLSDTLTVLSKYCNQIDVYDVVSDSYVNIDIRFMSRSHRDHFYNKFVNEWSLYGYGDLTTATI